MRRDRRRPEILAPAGDPTCLKAAIAAGADAVYLGMARFNARGRAERFRGLTLDACVRAAHDHGVRVYVTLNTLLHDDEMALAEELARTALEAGVDAAIVQDPGYAALLAREVPRLPLHGSTQMTIHQASQGEEAVAALGLKRLIVAREDSAEEIAILAERLRLLGAGVEVFVHGALCFAYSGQCLMSNFAGRRSANRGICAQNCRFDFVTGPTTRERQAHVPRFASGKALQLISLKDLAAFESVAELCEAGVEAFKIEGRLKGPEYVAETVRLYRAAVDSWVEGRTFSVEEARQAAGRVFSRGFTNGYLDGKVGPSMRGDKRFLEGEPDATVRSANRNTGILVLEPRPGHRILPGQGYRYAHDRYRGGFRVIGVREAPAGGVQVQVRFGAEARGRSHRRGSSGRRGPPPPLPVGLGCMLNDDPDLARRIALLTGTVEIREEPERVALDIRLRGALGEPLRAMAEAADGRRAEAETVELLQSASKHSLGVEILTEHLGRLGGTPYVIGKLFLEGLAPNLHASLPTLHALRRDIVTAMDRAAPKKHGASTALRGSAAVLSSGPARRTLLAVTVASPEAAGEAARAGADRIAIEEARILDGGIEWAEAWREAAARGPRPWFRLPPILHEEAAEDRAIEAISRCGCAAGVLAGHLGQLKKARIAGLAAAADYTLNATNSRTAIVYRALGAEWTTLSLELDAEECVRVAARSGDRAGVEVVIGGSVFSMLTRQEYDLQTGERFIARSEHGHVYRFEAAPGEGTILYEARELLGANALGVLRGRVDAVRLDLAHQAPDAVGEITGAYRAALDAERPDIAEDIHARHALHGSFQGHLFRGARLLDECS